MAVDMDFWLNPEEWKRKQKSAGKDAEWQNWLDTLKPGSQPGYSGAVDDAGNLKSGYELTGQASYLPQLESMLSGINYDRTALDELQNRAMSTTPSAWAGLARQANTANTANAMDAASTAGNAARSSAYSGLAVRGGLRQGARQNIARQSMKDILMAKQGVQNQGNINDLNIGLQDQATKDQMLSALPGQQSASLAPALQKAGIWTNAAQANQQYKTAIDQANINTRLQNLGNQNAWNLQNYQTNMGALAADRQSDAIRDSKGGFLGSWICTEVNNLDPLDTATLSELKKLRRSALTHAGIRTRFYLNGFGGLLAHLKKTKFDFATLRQFVLDVAQTHRNDPKAAVEMYWDKCVELCRQIGV